MGPGLEVSGVDLADYALFWPGVGLSVLLAVAWSARVARTIGRPRIFALGLLLSLGLIVSATLTPSRDAIRYSVQGSGACDLTHTAPPSLGEVLVLDERSLNLFLFVPLGFMVGFASVPRQTIAILGVAIALPFAIEATQLVATVLGRECESADIVDNGTGLVLGYALAILGRWAVNERRRRA